MLMSKFLKSHPKREPSCRPSKQRTVSLGKWLGAMVALPPALVNTVGDQQAAQQPEVPVAARAFFGNCTKWGPQALGFIAQLEEHSYGVGILAETHVGEAESLKLYRDLERLGWAARASHARQKHNGTSGGVVIFWKVNLQVWPVFKCERQTAEDPHCLDQGLDWVFRRWHLKQLTIAIGGAYFECSDSIGGTNAQRLLEIENFVARCRLPFVIFADWNMDPNELEQSGWLTRFGGMIRLPRDCDITCTSGRGRIIDFVLCSASFGGLS